ncbi:MAG: hypothetical protein PHI40_05425 [Caldisericia bacterium]|nr:hypothetical protein [Caldisericia bacterium]MDD4614827.1 hypothetical protein [Caldisericia bacterium]
MPTKRRNDAVIDETYRSYKREHDFDFPAETEPGKIVKETFHIEGFEKQSQKQLNHILGSIPSNLEDFEDLEEEWEEFESTQYKTRKEQRNAKSHKVRHKDSKNLTDFD